MEPKLHSLYIYLILFSASLFISIVCKDDTNTTPIAKEVLSKRTKAHSCKQCEMVVDYFQKAMKKTEKYHFDGGNAAWQEEKLGTYANSEIRLIEIQEILCEEKKTKDECLTLVENWEQHLENWWLRDRKTYPSLRIYLCVETLKICQPLECAKGWAEYFDEKVCADIDECLDQQSPCKEDEFCFNTQGSYVCVACDKACKGCYGPGPDKCKKYVEKDIGGTLVKTIGDKLDSLPGNPGTSERKSVPEKINNYKENSVNKYENEVEKPKKTDTKVVAMEFVIIQYIPAMIVAFATIFFFWESPFIGFLWILCLVIYFAMDLFSDIYF